MKNNRIIFFLISLFIVAFGQPAWFGFLSPISAVLGYAVFWYSLKDVFSLSSKLKISFVWYFIVQSIQLSWMTSIEYQGPYILLVYLFLLIATSAQFCFLTYLIYLQKPTVVYGVFISSVWTIMEWSRLYFISGFSWNPAAMAYANYFLPMQIASIAGVFGMSFYAIFGNFLFFRALVYKKHWLAVLIVATFPYFFGTINFLIRNKKSSTLKALLIQTALIPSEKNGYLNSFYSLPLKYQWQRVLIFLKEAKKDVNLIVLPEVAVPGGASRYLYLLEDVKNIWKDEFGENSVQNLPSLTKEYAVLSYDNHWFVNNKFWAKAISNQFNTSVVVGMDEFGAKKGESFNAAFFFDQNTRESLPYIKRVLVPIGEYFPFKWCKKIAEKLGITDGFKAGNKPVIFKGVTELAVSICYEETFSNIIRESRLLNAKLFVNISNDVWFPNSKLPLQHFHHGKLRAVENGVPLLRACNTGVTGGIDCFGRVVKTLKSDSIPFEKLKGALFVEIPLLHIKTLYTILGDGFIIGFSFLLSILIWRYNTLHRS